MIKPISLQRGLAHVCKCAANHPMANLDDDTRSRASRTTGHRAVRCGSKQSLRRSVRTKQQPAWEFALAQFKSSSVKARCRQTQLLPSAPGRARD